MIDGAEFERQGYALLRGLLDPDDLAPTFGQIELAVDRQIADFVAAGQLEERFGDDPMGTRWQRAVAALGSEQERRSWDADVVTPELFELMAHPRLLDVVEQLIGPEVEASGGIAVRPKTPHDKRTTVLWHQDSNYFGEDTAGLRMLSVWVPLVDVTETNGCMQVIPGSHEHGYQPSEMDPDHKAQTPLEDPTRFGAPVTCDMRVGDVLIFTNLTYHRSLMNVSDHTRWSIDFRYHGTGVSFERKQDFLPGFVARSSAAPASVATWSSWWADVKAHPYYAKMASKNRVAAVPGR